MANTNGSHSPRFLQVRNWDRFQQYKDRRPTWIKIYVELLDNYDFGKLPDTMKAHLVGIWLLAAQTDNRIAADVAWITRKINATEPVDVKSLISFGFLQYENVQNCTEEPEGAYLETETYTEEKEAKKEREAQPALDGKPLDEIECPGCGRLGSLKQSQGRNGNPPGFWCDRRLGCGANWPLNTSGILSQMTSRGRAAIEAMAAAEPRAKTPRKGGGGSWDKPDLEQASVEERAVEWIEAHKSVVPVMRSDIAALSDEAPEDIRGAVSMILIARNPHLRQAKGEAA